MGSQHVSQLGVRWLFLFIVSVLGVLLLVLAVLLVGLPIGWALRIAAEVWEERQPAWRVETGGGTLRLGLDGAWNLRLEPTVLRRRVDALPAVEVGVVELRLPLRSWGKGHALPDRVRIASLAVHARRTRAGAWEVAPAGPGPVSEGRFSLGVLPAALRPREGFPCALEVGELAVSLHVESGEVVLARWGSFEASFQTEHGLWILEAAATESSWPGDVRARLDADPSTDRVRVSARVTCPDVEPALRLVVAPPGWRASGSVEGSLEADVALAELPDFDAAVAVRGRDGSLWVGPKAERWSTEAWEVSARASRRGEVIEVAAFQGRGGLVLAGGRTLRFEVGAVGQVLPVPSGSARFRAALESAAGAVVSHAEVQVDRDGAFQCSLSVDPADATVLQPWVDLAAGGLQLEGTLAASVRIAGSLQPVVVREVELRVDPPTVTAAASSLLQQPLRMKASELIFSWRGDAGALEPWALEAGPLQVAAGRMDLVLAELGLACRGDLLLAPIEARRLLELVGPELRAFLQPFWRDLELLALVGAHVRCNATFGIEGTAPRFRGASLDLAADAALGGSPVRLQLTLEADAAAQRARVSVAVPDFVEADWELPLLRELPVPAVDAPTSLRLEAVAGFDGTLESARWRIESGSGRLIPRGQLLRWFVGPLPLTRFTAEGRIEGALERAQLDALSLQIGRGTLAFSRGELEMLAAEGAVERRASLRLAWDAADWYVEDFLALLSAEARALAPAELPPGRSGLRRLHTEADITATIEADGTLILTRFDTEHEGVLCVGGAELPLVLRSALDPTRRELVTRAELPEFVPAALGLPPPPFSPVAPGDFDLPVSALFLVKIPIPRSVTDSWGPPVVEVDGRAGPGRVLASAWLGAETEVRDASLAFRLELAPLAIRDARVRVDFGGPSVELRDAAASFAETIHGGAELRAVGFDLAWLRQRIPATLLETQQARNLARLDLRGRLDEANLEARLSLDLERPGSLLDDPRISAGLRFSGLEVCWDRAALGSVRSLRLEVQGDACRIEAGDISALGLRLGGASLSASGVLRGRMAAEVTGSGVVLEPWIRGEGASFRIALGGGLRSEPWVLDGEVDATAAACEFAPPLWSSPPGASAGVRVHAEGPALPEGRLVPEAAAFRIEGWGLPGGSWSAEGRAALNDTGMPREVRLTRWRAGAAAGVAHVVLPTAGPLDLDLGIDSLDAAAWVRELGPWLLQWNESVSRPPSAPEPPAAGVAAHQLRREPQPWGLPDLRARLAAGWVDLGGGHALARLSASFESAEGWPTALDLAFQGDGASHAVRWRAQEADALQVEVGDLGKLLEAAVAPLAALPDGSIPRDSLFDRMRVLPIAIRGGMLQLRGAWHPAQAEAWLEGSIRVTGMRLEREIESLTRIAALAKRRVILHVPFERLGAERFVVGSSGVRVDNAECRGPLDVTFDRLTYRNADTLLEARGRVFGLCFEVRGPAASPSFYLCENSRVIEAFTDEDDW